MALGVRGFNPIWSEIDLTGNLFDDTFYMFVLENTIPYIPAGVWHDPDMNVIWTNPIQFLANGTLPVDIFFLSEKVYRLEFRKGPDQSYPLIYEVNDYIAGEGGATPIDNVSLATSNQITNPQFSLVNFNTTFTLTGATNPDPIEIAPGWFLVLAGTGSVTATQLSLDNTDTNPSNAPYALRLALSGWNSGEVYLRQRFQQNGMLWANKTVASAITARIPAPGAFQPISATLVDSNLAPLGVVLDSTLVVNTFTEFTGHANLGATTNTDDPPAAYIEYRLALPSTVTIDISSIQLIAEDLELEPSFEQDSIERQIDHTFHYYKPLLEYKPISSYLVGWDFPLNPAQPLGYSIAAQAVGANKSYYSWDQTILFQSANSGITVSRAVQTNYLQLLAAVDTKMAVIQYLSDSEAKKILVQCVLGGVSVNVSMISTVAQTMTVSLWWNASVIGTGMTSNNSLVSALDANGYPTVTAGWTEITRDSLGKSEFDSLTGQLFLSQDFSNFFDAAAYQTGVSFAIVVGCSTVVAGNAIAFESISLVPGKIPTIPAPKTFNQTLLECQYYYQKSFLIGTVPAQSAGNNTGESYGVQGGGVGPDSGGPVIRFPTSMRATPNIVLYNPAAANGQIRNVTIGADWNGTTTASTITTQGFATAGTTNAGSSAGNRSAIHWAADARLGII